MVSQDKEHFLKWISLEVGGEREWFLVFYLEIRNWKAACKEENKMHI